MPVEWTAVPSLITAYRRSRPVDLVLSGAVVVCVLFAFLVGSGAIPVAFLFPALVSYIFMVIAGMRWMAVILLLGPLTLFVLVNNALQGLPFVRAERVLYVTIIGAMMIGPIFSARRRLAFDRVENGILLFLGFSTLCFLVMVVSGRYPVTLRLDIYFLLTYVMGFTGYLIARRIEWQEKQVHWLIYGLVVAGVFQAAIAILHEVFGVTLFVPEYMIVLHADRATGTFANASEFGGVLATILFLALFLFRNAKDSLHRAGLVLLMLAIGVGLVLSRTRAPWLAFVIAALLLFIRDPRIRIFMVVCGVLVIAVGAIALPFIVDLGELQDRLTHLGPILNRLSLWVTSVNMMLQNPFFGVGFGMDSFKWAQPEYTMDFGIISGQWSNRVGVPHNEYLSVGALAGVLGLLLYLSMLWRCLGFLRQTSVDMKVGPFVSSLAIYCGVILVNFMLNGLFVDTGKFTYWPGLVFFLMGMTASLSESGRSAGR